MWPLIAVSVTSLAFMIERALALRWRQVIPVVVENSAKACQTPEDVVTLRRLCQQNDSPASRLLILTIDRLHWPKAENVEALQTRARKEVAGLERGLVMIEAIVGSAPLLGLVGTLDGLIRSFGRFNEASMENSDVLAQGISIALHTCVVAANAHLVQQYKRLNPEFFLRMNADFLIVIVRYLVGTSSTPVGKQV